MKTIACILCHLVVACVAAVARGPVPSPAKFTLLVLDEDGVPMAKAPVTAGFFAEKIEPWEA